MAELHIDDDWKKQAQEEKRRLAEQAEKAAAGSGGAAAPAGAVASSAASAGARAGGRTGNTRRGERELPEATFSTLVQQTTTQILLYVGDLALRGNEGMVNLDMAKHHLDTLTMLEEKTKGNLTEEEKVMLDNALYETRMRYINVAGRAAELP